MALAQQKFREIVLQILYSQDIAQPEEALMTELIMEELSVSKRNVRAAQERVLKIREKLPEIDTLISSFSISYDFSRIQMVTKNILRLGVFELLFDQEIPPKVAIAEAIRLSRKFSTAESAAFVNAILDQLHQQRLGKSIDSQEISHQLETLLESEQAASEAAKNQTIENKESASNNETL